MPAPIVQHIDERVAVVQRIAACQARESDTLRLRKLPQRAGVVGQYDQAASRTEVWKEAEALALAVPVAQREWRDKPKVQIFGRVLPDTVHLSRHAYSLAAAAGSSSPTAGGVR